MPSESTREAALAVQRSPRIVGMFDAFSCPALAFIDTPPVFSRPTSGMTRLVKAAKAAEAAALPARPLPEPRPVSSCCPAGPYRPWAPRHPWCAGK
jgi:hypothetical protein